MNKKMVIKVVFVFAILLLSTFTFAYTNGKKTVEEPVVSWVSHTEYWRDDFASTIIRLADYRGNPYTVDECRVTILKPDKTPFIQDQPMSESGIPGNWYRTDSLENAPLGTYEQEVTCTKGTQEIKTSQSFHLNPALEQVSVLTEKTDNLDLELSDVNISLSGRVNETGEEINTNITNMNTNLNNLVNDLNLNMEDEFANTNANMNSLISNLDLSLQAKVDATGNTINTNINDAESNLTNLINQAVVVDLNNKLDTMLADLTNQLTNLQSDANWVVTHAMNDTDMIEIENRFSNIDSNLQAIENFCSTDDTNNSALCQEIYNIKEAINIMYNEQEAKLNEIDTTTTNTWDLLSGDIATNIDTLLADVGIIKSQTTDINQTTHQILDDMESEVNARIIS